MRHVQRSLQVLTAASVLLLGMVMADRYTAAQADTADAPSLTISQLKITSAGGQFVTLYNTTDATLDMSDYQLEYFNNYDLAKATSSKLVALTGSVPPHGYFMVSDDAVRLCYQMTIDSVSLGFSSTAGLVEVLVFNQPSGPGGPVSPVLQDFVGWSKTAAAGAQTLPSGADASLLRQPLDAADNPVISAAGAGSWQTVIPAADDPCNLVTAAGDIPVGSPGDAGGLLPGAEPPATIEALAASATGPARPIMPAADVGLMAPRVTELLPNPLGAGNDGTDEFIELYNPNAAGFDLSGFNLQTGTTSLHTYTFPAGARITGKKFAVFYSAVTGVSLSNSGGRAQLLDPFGNPISASGVYGIAKDGQAWALANGAWYWTSKPTPGAANIVNQPAAKSGKSAKKSKPAKTATKGAATANPAAASDDADAASKTPIHFRTLAAVAGAALLYGAYEYRADLANRIHELRQHLGNRARYRPPFTRRRGD